VSYYFSKKLQGTFDEIYDRTLASLKREGFGVLTEIDVQATLKKKLDVDFRQYKILGACNPSFAYNALQAEDKIGTMLPCNVIIQELGRSEVEVAAIDPIASMQAIKNEDLLPIAQQVQKKMMDVVENV
jgi:uncharacterized protein (DUF302 family)